MRQGGPEDGPRLLECGGVKCAVACQRQATDQFLSVNERSCLEKMINDLPGVLFKGIRIEPLDRFGDARVPGAVDVGPRCRQAMSDEQVHG